jgi:uncharacterized protein
MKMRLLPLGAGFLFAVGLAVSGMIQPTKVIGFLDFFGAWDPSLAFVMLGAAGVYLAAYRGLITRRVRPLYADRFLIPTGSTVDFRLLAGSAIFGIGWGLSGFCPGPALVSFGAASRSALWFVPAVLVGMVLFNWLNPDPARGDG